jgi:ribosomal protein S12 methylthiotransferase accessory factor
MKIREKLHKEFREGTHRIKSPDETLQNIKPFMPIMGITRIANVTGLDNIGIPVVMVCRPNSRSLSVTQGKGLSLSAAKASGLMESVETYHAEHITLPLKLASYEELRYTHSIVELDLLPRILNSLFHPNLRILWIEGYDLLQDELIWVPYELVHTDYRIPLPTGSGCFPTTSNGLASGNHLLEAISHGICEVIERDSTSLWVLGDYDGKNKEVARIDTNTIDDSDCQNILYKFYNANIEVGLWETTTDIGIPSFVCTIVERSNYGSRDLYPTSGMGCHPSRKIALLRALTEAAQSRLTMISGSRDDNTRNEYEYSRDQNTLNHFRNELKTEIKMCNFNNVTTKETETLDQDVEWELLQLRSAGIKRAIMVNLTKIEFGIPVVRMIIPGLEGVHKFPGYVPGIRAKTQIDKK